MSKSAKTDARQKAAEMPPTVARAADEAARRLGESAASEKCLACGCFHDALSAVERLARKTHAYESLNAVIERARPRLLERRYDCLGCDVCYPALAANALDEAGVELPVNSVCGETEQAQEREGWPPLPGKYIVLRYKAPVAVCALTDEALPEKLAREAAPEIAIVGALQTENLGIERVIANVLANPNIRFLIVCGIDSRQAVGHLPGQSLLQLARSGIDGGGSIIGAEGKRPVIRNIPLEAVERFRDTVEVVGLVGETGARRILRSARACSDRYPGPAEPFAVNSPVSHIAGYVPGRMTPDPSGYFVIYVDHPKDRLCMEHYTEDGALDALIEGRTAAQVYFPAIDRRLVSRMDHAAYLGSELARAERALELGEDYTQDAAPESDAETRDCASSCACKPDEECKPA